MMSFGMGAVALAIIAGWVATGIILRAKLEAFRAELPQANEVAE